MRRTLALARRELAALLNFPAGGPVLAAKYHQIAKRRGRNKARGANARQVWMKALLPAAMPSFCAGLRIAATYSVVGAIFGEYITAQRGLGVFLKRSYSSFRLDQAYLAILLTALLSLLLVLLVNLVERLALRWYYTSRRTSWRGPGIY